jgi:hypothetical protein
MTRSEYRLSDGVVSMSAVLTNPSPDTLYVDHCSQDILALVDRLDSDGWRQIDLLVCGHRPPAVAVAPGRTVSLPITLRVGANLSVGELGGTFRLRLPVYTSVDRFSGPAGLPLPVEQTTSRNFVIRE